jgi:hypothetical protein
MFPFFHVPNQRSTRRIANVDLVKITLAKLCGDV